MPGGPHVGGRGVGHRHSHRVVDGARGQLLVAHEAREDLGGAGRRSTEERVQRVKEEGGETHTTSIGSFRNLTWTHSKSRI